MFIPINNKTEQIDSQPLLVMTKSIGSRYELNRLFGSIKINLSCIQAALKSNST